MELAQALEYEAADELESIEEMMASMLESADEAGEYIRPDLDEYTIRKMMLARNYIKKDVDKLKEMKKQVSMEWDRRINNKNEQIDSINNLINDYIQKENNGKALSFDVGTASLKRQNHKVKVKDKDVVIDYLKKNNALETFLKPRELNETAAAKHFIDQFDEHVKNLASERVRQEVENSKSNKITKTREKEILKEITEEQLPFLRDSLPEGFEFIEPSYSLSIRTNI